MSLPSLGRRRRFLRAGSCLCACFLGSTLYGTSLLHVLGPEQMTRRNLLQNRGFEGRDTEGWHAWEEGFEAAPGLGRNGSDAVRCASDDPALEYGAGQRIVLDQEKTRTILAAGYSLSQDVDDPVGSGYSVYVDLQYRDGSHLWAQSAPFDVGTHGWQRKEILIRPEKPVKELLVYALFRGHTGSVLFDDFTVEEWTPPEGTVLFDRMSVLPRKEPVVPSCPRILDGTCMLMALEPR